MVHRKESTVTQRKKRRLQHLVECGYKRLCKPERKYQLGSSHEQFGRQSLEERREAFVAHHLGHNLETALGVVEVPVLNPSLDHVQRCRDDQGSAGTGDGSNKVLAPRSGVVVLEFIQVFLGCGRTTEELSLPLDQTIINIIVLAVYIPQMSPARYGRQSIPNHGTNRTLRLQ